MYILLVGLVVVFFAAAIYLKEPAAERLGIAKQDNKGGHVATKEYGGVEPPTSGDHSDPVQWGPYATELADVKTLHNLEHGGIYVSYTSDIPEGQVKLMEELLFPPYSAEGFKPLKVVLAPRAKNDSPIILSSWNRSLKLDAYDKDTIINYYNTNSNKSPEPGAR